MTIVRKSEIENLTAGFRAEVTAEIVKHRDAKALGVVGGFIANIEAHRGRYARKLATIRVGADPATITLASETDGKLIFWRSKKFSACELPDVSN
jgi:hypothetical protein